MTKHRFFISKEQIRNENAFLSGDQARQIYNVLRLRQGDRIHVLKNNGWEYEVELLTTTPDLVTGRLVDKWPVSSEPTIHLTLFQSMLKQDKFEWILQKGTEIGITSFVPMISERAIVRQTPLKQNKIARWQRIMCEAAEQSGRGRIPTISQPITYAAALTAAQASHLAMIPWESESKNSVAATLDHSNRRSLQRIQTAALLIGPEGGFTESEIVDAQAADITPVTLGPRILRAETAAIVAATLTLHELGQMNSIKQQDSNG